MSKGMPMVGNSGYQQWLQLGTLQMAGWAEYRYGKDKRAWPINVQQAAEHFDLEFKGTRQARGPYQKAMQGIPGMLFTMLMDALDDIKRADRLTRRSTMRWVNGADAPITFDTLCSLLELNKPYLRRAFNQLAKEMQS